MGKAVLIVDDSATVRNMVAFTLTKGGYTVHEADDGLKGLEVLSKNKIDFAIVDINMPNLNGIEMVRQMRSNPSTTSIPAIFLTTERTADMVQKGQEVGVTGWMVKPFNPEVLLQAVQKLVGS